MGIALLLIVACSPKDEEYYFKNLDIAVDKASSCDQALIKAATINDEKTLLKLKEDQECQAAFNALRKQSQLERDRERAEEERQRAIEQAAREQEISDLKKSISQSLSGKNWQEVIAEYFKQDECQKLFLDRDNYHCVAWKSLYEHALIEGKEQLSQESFADLNRKESIYCGLDKRRGSACDVWQQAREARVYQDLAGLDILALEALKEEYCSAKGEYQICAVWKERWQEQNKHVVDRLMKDDALFMERYNHCTTLVEEIRHSGKSWGERNRLEREIVNHYPCVQAAEAYRKRGLSRANFSTPVVLEKNVSK